ncbi:hypothetical protein R6Z07F_006957 [Ovis aries]
MTAALCVFEATPPGFLLQWHRLGLRRELLRQGICGEAEGLVSRSESLQGSHLLKFTAKMYLHPQSPWMTSSPPCIAGPLCVHVHLPLERQAPNPKTELMII